MKAIPVPLLAVLVLTLACCGELISGGKSAIAAPAVQAKELTPEQKFAATKKKAEAGDADAQFSIGLSYDTGKGVPEDSTKAVEWYQKAAEQGHVKAQSQLAYMYGSGDGVPKDWVKAVEWWQKAAEQGHVDAQLKLANIYAFGDGVPKDSTKSAEWFQKAAEQGDADAQYSLGLSYAYGIGIPDDAAKAVEWYQKAAAQGHASAQFNLGVMYGDGDGVPKDTDKAVEWLQKAAEQGHAQAQNRLANMAIMVEFLQNRAEQGYASAQYDIGLLYASGGVVPKDDANALKWLQKAAEQGHVEAQRTLGTMYAIGKGVPKDEVKSVEWYQKAAAQGDARAQFTVGLSYYLGTGVPKDSTKAVKWWQKAAAQGHADAQSWLGGMYSIGEGVTKNKVSAYAWLSLAAAQGDEDAKKLLGKLEAVVSPEQRAEGQRLASNWKAGGTFEDARNIPDAEDARWKPVGNSGKYFIDTTSIKKTDSLIYVWVKDNTTENQKNGYKLTRWVINCSNDTFDLISSTTIDSSGNRTGGFDIDPSEVKLKSSQPDSLGDVLIRAACSTSANAAPFGEAANSTGSGFVVSASGYLLTNNHVVNGCTKLKVHDSAKVKHDVIVVATDAKNDLALLKTIKPASLPAATFRANGSVESGESVVALGYPLAGMLASEVNVSFGYVSATAGVADDTSKLQISAPVQPGNSGGPLLDQSGNLIGVVVSKLDALKVAKAIGDIPQNINFAVKNEIAQVFLKAHKVKFKTAATTKKLENTDIASRGRAFTVLVECYK